MTIINEDEEERNARRKDIVYPEMIVSSKLEIIPHGFTLCISIGPLCLITPAGVILMAPYTFMFLKIALLLAGLPFTDSCQSKETMTDQILNDRVVLNLEIVGFLIEIKYRSYY